MMFNKKQSKFDTLENRKFINFGFLSDSNNMRYVDYRLNTFLCYRTCFVSSLLNYSSCLSDLNREENA